MVKKDAEVQSIMIAVNEGWNCSNENLKPWRHLKEELTCAQGLLWRGRRICVPAKLTTKPLRLAHKPIKGLFAPNNVYVLVCFGREWTQTWRSSVETVKLV